MDAYHLAHTVLVERGSVGRKGAPDTFDAAGYVALLARLRAGEPGVVWAPQFRREIEDAIAGAVAVPPDAAAGGDRRQLPAAARGALGEGDRSCWTRSGTSTCPTPPASTGWCAGTSATAAARTRRASGPSAATRTTPGWSVATRERADAVIAAD